MTINILVLGDSTVHSSLSVVSELESLYHKPPRFSFIGYEGEVSREGVGDFVKKYPAQIQALAVCDPPHHGLYRAVIRGIEGFDKVLLVSSCNPDVDRKKYDVAINIPSTREEFWQEISSLLDMQDKR